MYQIGLCPRKDKDHAELYALHVTHVQYLAKKGLKMMIWCDMLQPTEGIRRLIITVARYRHARFHLVLHFDLDMEDHIPPHGYKVIMGNLYPVTLSALAQRIAKEGMIGGEVSTWCRIDEYTLAKGQDLRPEYTAEMLWSESYLIVLIPYG